MATPSHPILLPLRAIEPADLGWIADLEARSFPTPWSAASLALEVEGPYALGYAATRADGQGLGYVLGRVLFEDAHLLKIAVAPQARRGGTGRALLAAFEAGARALGGAMVVLEVRVGNAPARALYEAAGYRRVAWRRGYYPDGEDGLILQKPLEDPA